MNFSAVLLLLSISFLLTLLFVPLCIGIAYRYRILDVPDGSVKKHKIPVPYLGGIAIYFGFVITSLTAQFSQNFFWFFLGIGFFLLIGLVDDLIILNPHQKFFAQILVSAWFLKLAIFATVMQNNYIFFVSLFWMLIIVNAFNLLDVMDGLATVIAWSTTISFLLIAFYFQYIDLIFLLICFLGSLTAFFFFNKPPAKIYLGDAGSLFIGSFLAAISLLFFSNHCETLNFLVLVLIFGVPLLEVITLILIRFYKKIPIYKASPDHFALYFQRVGWRKETILFYVLFVSMIFSSIAFSFVTAQIKISKLIFFALIALIVWFFILIKNIISLSK